MITSVAEGLERYKEKLREHKKWTDAIKEKYGDFLTEHGPIAALSDEHWHEAQERTAKLKAMVDVFGLTPEEEVAIDREIGIHTPAPAAASN